MTNQELKPCPFCGGEATHTDLSAHCDSDWHSVGCIACDIKADGWCLDECLKDWNTRHLSPQQIKAEQS